MTIHVLRDYAAAGTGYFAPGVGLNYLFTPWLYNTAVFLYKILGYSLVGNTAFDVSNTNVQTNSNIATVAIASGSDGQSLPQSTIFVSNTTNFPNNGTIYVGTSAGTQVVNYAGLTSGAFLNCTGGTGTMTAGQATTVAAGSNNVNLPTATINVASTAGFPSSGTIFIVSTTGVVTVAYTGTSGGNQFTGCTGGTGTINTNNPVTSAGGAVACSPLNVVAGTGTPWTITTNFPHGMSTGQYATVSGSGNIPNGVWPINVVNSTQMQLLYTAGGTLSGGFPTLYPPGMLIASGTVASSKGASINVTGASSVYAVSIPPNVRTVQNGAAPASGDVGRILVLKSSKYPTKNSGLFKISSVNVGNNTTIASSSNNVSLPQSTINVASTAGFPSSGSLYVYTSTGVQTVTYTATSVGNQFIGCTGGTGLMSTGNTVNNFNGYNIDYRSSDTPPPDTMDWWLYEVETQVSYYTNYPNYAQTNNIAIAGATNTAPIQITTSVNIHTEWITGQRVTISGVGGNTAANGTWTITNQSPTTTSGVFTLNGSSGNGTYTSGGTASRLGYTGGDNVSVNSKVILQSPHSTGWQVRLAVEPYNITDLGSTSITVGFGGTSAGDFTVGGPHTHTAQFFDLNPFNSTPYVFTVPGTSNTGTVAIRTSLVGDDGGQAVFCLARSQGATNHGLTTFGIPDNEPTPLATTINRPFVYGGVNASDFGNLQMILSTTNNFGMTFRDLQPEVCAIAGWAYLDGAGQSPVYSPQAGDSPFTGTTEVLPWEIWAGIATDPSLNLPFNSSNGIPSYGLNQRLMGTAPFIRQGRTNFGNFTLSTDNTTIYNISVATNTTPIQITTSATNALTSGQTVVITGVTGNLAANGTWVISVIDNTHFTLTGSAGNGGYAGGGTVQGTPHWLHLQNGIYLQWNGAGGLTP